MFNRRVSKSHPRVEAYGTVDELNSALGLARATAENSAFNEQLQLVQHDLVALMGELATAPEDMERLANAGYARFTPEMTAKLDRWIQELEAQQIRFHGWATPGANLHAAALDVARTVCRRAERRVCALQENEHAQNPEILVYLNRLSDWLWLLARAAEPPAPSEPRLV
jgi:cob(I)alamin adenosyltransferase